MVLAAAAGGVAACFRFALGHLRVIWNTLVVAEKTQLVIHGAKQ
jgi:hypothetical protein